MGIHRQEKPPQDSTFLDEQDERMFASSLDSRRALCWCCDSYGLLVGPITCGTPVAFFVHLNIDCAQNIYYLYTSANQPA